MTGLTNGLLVERLARAAAWTRSVGSGLKVLKKAPGMASPGIVMCHVRDEMVQLPHFLKHYRDIGVERFVFVDNGSRDGTTEFLLEQGDCDLFQDTGNFRESGEGTLWKNYFMSEYRDAPWYFGADVDEHAVYDGWPSLGLNQFAEVMSARGRGVVTAVLVDMYGPGPLAGTVILPGKSLLDACPLFDGDGYSIAMPENWRAQRFPRLDIRGGPEKRCFGAEVTSWLAKAPLVLEPNIVFCDPHGVYPAALNFAAPRIALLHFRFFASLVEKIARLRERERDGKGQASASVYRLFAESLRADPAFSLAYPGSVRFDSPQRFIERNMIKSSAPEPLA